MAPAALSQSGREPGEPGTAGDIEPSQQTGARSHCKRGQSWCTWCASLLEGGEEGRGGCGAASRRGVVGRALIGGLGQSSGGRGAILSASKEGEGAERVRKACGLCRVLEGRLASQQTGEGERESSGSSGGGWGRGCGRAGSTAMGDGRWAMGCLAGAGWASFARGSKDGRTSRDESGQGVLAAG
jgi:hypothetical protein